jgi:hypothetical protein
LSSSPHQSLLSQIEKEKLKLGSGVTSSSTMTSYGSV